MQTLNKRLKRMLRRTGLHSRLKSSWIHDVTSDNSRSSFSIEVFWRTRRRLGGGRV